MSSQRRRKVGLGFAITALAVAMFTPAAWRHVEPRALADVASLTGLDAVSIAPFVLCTDQSDNITVRRSYHVWALGRVLSLPHGRSFPEVNPVVFTVTPRIIVQRRETPLNGAVLP